MMCVVWLAAPRTLAASRRVLSNSRRLGGPLSDVTQQYIHVTFQEKRYNKCSMRKLDFIMHLEL